MDNYLTTQEATSSIKENKGSKELSDHLLESVTNDDLDKVVELLVESVDVNIEGIVNGYGCNPISPLCLAACQGYTEIVRALLQIPNIDVNQMDYYKTTALHRASGNGHLEVVEALLATKKADVNAELAKTGFTPLHLASRAGHEEIVEALLKAPEIQVNKSDECGMTALHRCSSRGHVEVAKLLMKAPGILVNEKDYDNDHTALHLAADFHHFDVAEVLLSHPDTNINVKDKYNQTALHTSAYHGDINTVEMLLQGGIDANAKTDQGFTAVYWAAKQGKYQVVEMIINHIKNIETHGIDPNARRKQVGNLTQKLKREEISKKQNRDIARNENDPNHQLLLAVKNDDLGKIEELLKEPDIDANTVDKINRTPLHLASERGSVEMIKMLLKIKNIEVNAKTIDKSKQMYPTYPGDDPNRGKLEIGKTPLYLAVSEGHIDVVKVLLDHPETDVNVKDKYSAFPLWQAVEYGDIEMVEALLNHPRIDVNAICICSGHYTSLHRAVENGDLEIVNMLLRHPNIDLNVKDKHYGGTPLHFAVRKREIKVLEAILNHPKVRLDTLDMYYATPLQDAEERGNSEIIKILREAQARAISKDKATYEYHFLKSYS